MGEPLSISAIPGAGRDVRASIARAAERTGVDFDYLLAQARIESSLNPEARARTSSAAGLYQFTRGTWLETLGRHGAEHGLGWAQAAIARGQVADPAMRAQIMALRHDPDAAALMAGELAGDNRDALQARLGRDPDAAELYLAHFLGSGGAGQLLSAIDADPGQSAAALLPSAAAANRAIFYDGGGAPRSVAGVMDVIRAKVANAMGRDSGTAWPPSGEGMPDWPDPAAAMAASSAQAGWAGADPGQSGAMPAPQAPARPSMADTLRDAFGLADAGGTGAAPAFVHKAYASLRSFGL